MGLLGEVRAHCAAVASAARHVGIRGEVLPPAGGRVGLDPEVHLLDAPAEDRARYILILDAINFGSGWFDELRVPPGADATTAISRALSDHARHRGGPWTAAEMRTAGPEGVAEVLGQDPRHELMALYARALRDLGTWLGDRTALDLVADAGGSAERFARALADGMPFFRDAGFYKRAQITANDLVLAGVAEFGDADELTIFADNLVPHVLRLDGVLEYEPALAARIDAGEELPAGSRAEIELRACAVHACEGLARRLGIPPRILDNQLWNRGVTGRYAERPAHRTRTVFY